MDQASLTVHNEFNKRLVVSWLSEHCYQCLFQELGNVHQGKGEGHFANSTFIVDSKYPLTLQLNITDPVQEVCRVSESFGEFGHYSLWVVRANLSVGSEQVNCTIITDQEPINSSLPILYAFLFYIGLAILIYLGRHLLRLQFVQNLLNRLITRREPERLINSEVGTPNRAADSTSHVKLLSQQNPGSRRLRSLDTFRGLALVIMVFVNYGAGKYWFLEHERWNGLTLADLVFPWFVFIMGTSIALALSSALRNNYSRWKLLGKVTWRTVVLVLLGIIIINPNYCKGPLSWGTLRIPGVLQRLGLSYFVVIVMELQFGKGSPEMIALGKWWSPFRDILIYWPQWILIVLLETVWLCLTFLFPVPDCPRGYLGPGGIGHFGQFANCTGGAAGYIDRIILGESHIYQHPSCTTLYHTTLPYDPEGLLGLINSIVMAFLGLQAGKIFLIYKGQNKQITLRFFIWSLVLGTISAILTKCSRDEGFIPVNKNLWSISYITTLSCFAYFILMIVYFLVDVRKWWSGAPFYYPGMNSILVYVGHEVFAHYFPFKFEMHNPQSHGEHLAQNLFATSIWVLIAYILYRKKIFWKI
ncbi:heparan-alpha-glucosaminide N-acetyltransferase [Callorhinchus milii]|nr:heparan-alpha-glucosaminide N-acetyltransferase [Callorhinchus milii]XP_007894738.1 heparan-alpha-glucosaminide N-acetyltransferase [Callorhinchus milii]XP_042195296.1 heparan-alpha-glucosaminide N-acetyltransferase [Callorhinchus milii]XP_042195298.1 heparan-alpha-glucosaminide N-acetyltransferase [Callorhinchus milii]|eukprot:gi/632957900/ref/XP_007894737.1/ PREDICTED: heparan-alpha-glucosaminide N-acetyltransferase [Callorhinchus milii]